MIDKNDLIGVIENRIEQLWEQEERAVFDISSQRIIGAIDELDELVRYLKESY